jgi:hypothetical protein
MRLKSFNRLNALSMRQRSLYRRLLKLNGCFLLLRLGMTGLVPRSSSSPRNGTIVCFASGQQDGDEAAFSICECVNLRVAPSARTANSLLLLPPFPPAAERCALTCVESIICISADRPFPASSRNRFSHMPRRAQRTKRL